MPVPGPAMLVTISPTPMVLGPPGLDQEMFGTIKATLISVLDPGVLNITWGSASGLASTFTPVLSPASPSVFCFFVSCFLIKLPI